MSKTNRSRSSRSEIRTYQMQGQSPYVAESQLNRIANHPLDVKGNYIVIDNLECGVIEILEHTGKDTPLHLQWDGYAGFITGATLVGKTSISYMSEEDVVVVEDMYYKEGHAELRDAMFNQVLDFVDFYNNESMALDKSVVPEWLAEKEMRK